MKRSRTISISLVSSLAGAAVAAGCGSAYPGQQQGWQTCVERARGTTVEQRYCDDESRQPQPSGYVPRYHWYYYPRGYYWEAPRIGSPVPPGGSYGLRAFGSAPMARSGSVVRGGFGSTASGHASGGQ